MNIPGYTHLRQVATTLTEKIGWECSIRVEPDDCDPLKKRVGVLFISKESGEPIHQIIDLLNKIREIPGI